MTAISTYSTTPASNTSVGGVSVAENCPIANLNNAFRGLAAEIRDYANDAEWFAYGDGDGAATVSYVSATSFKIVGSDQTAKWHVGRRVKVVAATPGTIYGTIATSAFSTDTTLTITWDSGSLSNEALTAYLAINSVVNTSLPVSSTTNKGIIEAATTTEQLTGTDAARAATPDSIAALWEKGSDIASAGTISIGEGGYFHVTGTTTITDIDFGTDKAGRAAWLVFDGALTLTHNSTTLILPTGANITTAAGDACLVVSEDGSDNVRVPVYSRKNGSPLATPILLQAPVRTSLATSSTTTNAIPNDDTIPQQGGSEGTEIMTRAITPISATSVLQIEVLVHASLNTAGYFGVALFQDSTADALAVSVASDAGSSAVGWQPVVLRHYMTSGTTSSTTFKVRVGPVTAGTLTYNGTGGARKFGGVLISSITVTEYAA